MGTKDDGLDSVRGAIWTYIKAGASTMGFTV